MSDSEYNSFPQAGGFTWGQSGTSATYMRLLGQMTKERIVAVGLLTQREVALLGATFDRLWPVEEAPEFQELLDAIDHADEELQISHAPVVER